MESPAATRRGITPPKVRTHEHSTIAKSKRCARPDRPGALRLRSTMGVWADVQARWVRCREVIAAGPRPPVLPNHSGLRCPRSGARQPSGGARYNTDRSDRWYYARAVRHHDGRDDDGRE